MINYVDSKIYKHQDEWYEQAAHICRFLPSGMECFGDWSVTQTHSSLRFKGYYKVGDYTGQPKDVVFFTLILPKDPEKDFKIQFNTKHSRYLAKKYVIRSYLRAEIGESLYSMSAGYGSILDFGYFGY
tara:strand:- start:935 stop:1318 length:384 start_codon:yes stop_codon:yes gene_type:complete